MALIYDIKPPIKKFVNPEIKTHDIGIEDEGFIEFPHIEDNEAQRIVDLRDKSIFDRTVYAWSWWDFNEERFKHSSFTLNSQKPTQQIDF